MAIAIQNGRPDPQPNFDSLKPSLSERLAAHKSGSAYDSEIEAALKRFDSQSTETQAIQSDDDWKTDWREKNLETFKNWMFLWLKKGELRDPKKIDKLYRMYEDLQQRQAI